MERFSAAAFMYISRTLAELRFTLTKLSGDAKMNPQTIGDGHYDLTKAIGEKCREIGLKTSQLCADEVARDLQRGITAAALGAELSELDNTIRREIWSTVFFYMPGNRSEFYGQTELFGAGVNRRFPTIQYDMVEAGNCLAMARSTACVFHLMRIMEVGVQEFGNKLGVTLVAEKNWQNILDEINKAIKGLPPRDPLTVEMSQASANLYSVKLAWRNEVMHPNDTYTLEEAENLIRQVKLFMAQLAAIV